MGKARISVFVLLVATVPVLLFTCKSSPTQDVNHQPVIETFTPTSDISLNPGQTMQFSVTADDSDGDSLTYTWEMNGGGSMSSIDGCSCSYTAPQSGYCTLTLTVSDGNGGVITQVWNVTVSHSTNQAPRVSQYSPPLPLYPAPGQSLNFFVSGYDPDGDQFTYTWTASAGTLSSTSGSSVTWTAPTSGNITVNCRLEDIHGATKDQTWVFSVYVTSSDFEGTWESEGTAPVMRFTVGPEIGTRNISGWIVYTFFAGNITCNPLPSGSIQITAMPPEGSYTNSIYTYSGVITVRGGSASDPSYVYFQGTFFGTGRSQLYGNMSIKDNYVSLYNNEAIYFRRIVTKPALK
jgi:hypothetical protein